MKKSIIVLMLLGVILMAGCSVESIENSNEEIHLDCPFGKVDCEYPGNCGRYIDTNENNICDHSE